MTTAESITVPDTGAGDLGPCEDYHVADDGTPERCPRTGRRVEIDGMQLYLCSHHLTDRQQRARGRVHGLAAQFVHRLTDTIPRLTTHGYGTHR